ncbi:CPBP family intramembrane glutamic endopeptidase [Nannocystis punicea]|uniref:CPBP family intramembrane metalloprotease n=1 Tax=Nannocystis punicea TaxID=2995304 RepID=A0ABY7H6M4_9BACT|nr:CPBP family intramembrane glutamic endopeptidase [Nannocystis poenicansa]WAS94917.1 CPBP family intramembrane metalloprotease [Nannocystis poenicansa]
MAALIPLAGVFGVPFAYPLLVLAATALVYRLEREPMSELGLTPTFARMGLGLLGLLGGAAMVAIRAFTVSGIFGGRVDLDLSAPIVFLLSSVLVEELLFRGYPFMRFVHGRGTWAAIVLFAVAFGVYHWVQWGLFHSPVAMLFTLLSTGSGHVLFAVAFLRSRTLWPAIGLHLGWNVADQALTVNGAPGTAAFLAGFAVSELLVAAVVVAMLRGAAHRTRSPSAAPA